MLIGSVLIMCTLSYTHQTEHMQGDSTRYVLSGDKGALEEWWDQRSRDQT
ncbi:unnamed protein product, partial [Staurois parvus]